MGFLNHDTVKFLVKVRQPSLVLMPGLSSIKEWKPYKWRCDWWGT